MSHAIRSDAQIHGCRLPYPATTADMAVKVRLYADDSNIFLQYENNDTSIKRVFDKLEIYQRASGAKLNLSKCKAVVFGGNNSSLSPQTTNFILAEHFNKTFNPPIKLQAIELGINVLGISFYGRQHVTYIKNYTKILEKIRQKLNFLRMRKLSIKGRALAVNTLVLSKLWYLASVIPLCSASQNSLFQNTVVDPSVETAPDFVTLLNRQIYTYVWDHNWNPVKKSVLQLPTGRGGLGLLSIELQSLALRAKQINQIFNQQNKMPSTRLARYWLAPYLQSVNNWVNFLENYVVEVRDRPYPLWGYHSNRGYDSLITLMQDFAVKRKFQNINNPPTCKTIYKVLFGMEDRTIAGESIWRSHGFSRPFWQNSWLALNNNREQEKLWKLRHFILHYEDRNADPATFLNHPQRLLCLTCQQQFRNTITAASLPRDTHIHVFTECPQDIRTWNLLLTIMHKIDPRKSLINIKEWLLGMNGNNKISIIFNTLLTSTINAIWIARCNFAKAHPQDRKIFPPL